MENDYSHITEDFVLDQIEGICNNYQFFIRDEELKQKGAYHITQSIEEYLFKIDKEHVMRRSDIYIKVCKELGL